MDPALQPSTPQNTLPTMSTSSGKRSRENESPSQRHKREKAAERQRRKRERDRNASLQNVVAIAAAQQQQPPQQHPPPVIAAVTHPQPPLPTAPAQTVLPPTAESFAPSTNELSAAELSRRERVRSAARERQRKHRALVKQKKLRELGLDMGNELGVQGLEDMQYRIATEGAPFGALQHDLGQQPIPGQPGDPSFQPGAHGGQTFASTLLLSFSCAPLLKQHILRTLSMTNEELASLEPIIAQAWDQWDHQVRIPVFALCLPANCFFEISLHSAACIMHIKRRQQQVRRANLPMATHSVMALPRQLHSPTWANRHSLSHHRRTRISHRRRTTSARAFTVPSSRRPRSARSHRRRPNRLVHRQTGSIRILVQSSHQRLLLLLLPLPPQRPPRWRLLRRLTRSLGRQGERPRVSLDDWSGVSVSGGQG